MIGRRIPYGIKLDKRDLDITNANSVKSAFDKHCPQLLIHLAALKDKTYCQKNPLAAYDVNVLGSLNVARECQSRNIPIIFVSSSYVFDGKSSRPYKENDQTAPFNVYGRTKLIGELIVRDLVEKSSIVRLGLVYGKGIEDSFVDGIVNRILNGIAIKENSQNRFSFTNIENLIKGINFIIENNLSGTFHLTEKGGQSYFEAAKFIGEYLNPNVSVAAVLNGSDDGYIIPRGGFEVLEPSAVFSPSDWKEPLRDYLLSLHKL